MATVSFISPKVMFNKLAEAIYTPVKQAPQKQATFNKQMTTKSSQGQPKPTLGNKLNVSIDDVKIISASLIYYKKFLARKKEMEKAEEVGEVDKKFMEFIQALEGFPINEEAIEEPAMAQPKRQKTLKRTLVTEDFDPNKEYKTPKLPQDPLQTEWVVKKPKTKKRSVPQFVR